jgi:hypothetical protein
MGQRATALAGRSHGSTPVGFLMRAQGGRGARILRTDASTGAVLGGMPGRGALSGHGATS